MRTYTRALVSRARDMRRVMTEAERRLWLGYLRSAPGRFRRQRPIGPYIVDFYSAARRLVIEVDGDTHALPHAVSYDEQRTAFMLGLGLRVVRIHNDDVLTNLAGVAELLAATAPV